MAERQQASGGQSDEELIAAFQRGHQPAFDALVGRYKDQLMNFVFRFVGDFDEADDVVQETLVRLFQKKDAYQPVAKFSTWIYTIAANLAKTRLRSRKRASLFSLTRPGKGQDERDYELPDVRYRADSRAESALQHELIQKALNSIPPKYSEVVILCDVQELSYEEICAITGLNIGTVKSRLNRGRAQLQELLKEL